MTVDGRYVPDTVFFRINGHPLYGYKHLVAVDLAENTVRYIAYNGHEGSMTGILTFWKVVETEEGLRPYDAAAVQIDLQAFLTLVVAQQLLYANHA